MRTWQDPVGLERAEADGVALDLETAATIAPPVGVSIGQLVERYPRVKTALLSLLVMLVAGLLLAIPQEQARREQLRRFEDLVASLLQTEEVTILRPAIVFQVPGGERGQGSVAPGDVVGILARTPGWLRIERANTQGEPLIGWIQEEAIEGPGDPR